MNSIEALDLTQTYSYADYLLWHFEEHLELIKGKVFRMSPAPNVKHQRTASNLHFIFKKYFSKKKSKCQVFFAPFDVRLLDRRKSVKSNQEIFSVVQPDLCIICDKNKLDEQGCLGSPDLIVEILSKGNSKKEMKIKYQLYEENSVPEYWVIYPYEEILQQFVLNEQGKYYLYQTYVTDDTASSYLFPDLKVSLEQVFEE
jgi:Uma2 family endonuclease